MWANRKTLPGFMTSGSCVFSGNFTVIEIMSAGVCFTKGSGQEKHDGENSVSFTDPYY